MLKPILLVEDNPHDLELTLVALERSQLANEVIVLRDGAEALDYLLRRVDRDLGSLTALLDRLDRASLAAQRRVTVPFLRGLLAAEG